MRPKAESTITSQKLRVNNLILLLKLISGIRTKNFLSSNKIFIHSVTKDPTIIHMDGDFNFSIVQCNISVYEISNQWYKYDAYAFHFLHYCT